MKRYKACNVFNIRKTLQNIYYKIKDWHQILSFEGYCEHETGRAIYRKQGSSNRSNCSGTVVAIADK